MDHVFRFSIFLTDFMAIYSVNFWEMGVEIFNYYCILIYFSFEFKLFCVFASQSFANRTESQVSLFQSSLVNVAYLHLWSILKHNINKSHYSDIMHFLDRYWQIPKMLGETPNSVFQLAYGIKCFKMSLQLIWTYICLWI